MEKFLKIVENTIWYRQFVYGTILVILFGFFTLAAGFSPIWAIAQVIVIAWAREDYLRDLKGSFNWRNFYFLQVPGLLFYFFWTAF